MAQKLYNVVWYPHHGGIPCGYAAYLLRRVSLLAAQVAVDKTFKDFSYRLYIVRANAAR